MTGHSLVPGTGGATLTTRVGSGTAERWIPQGQLEGVCFPELGREPHSGASIHPSAVVLIPWIQWLEEDDLLFLRAEAARVAGSPTATDALVLLEALASGWPPEIAGRPGLLESAGELHARLGWLDRLEQGAVAWIGMQASERDSTSAWGWWRLAELQWRANAIGEAVWTASHPIAFTPDKSARGLAECFAFAIAGERRLGHPGRAEALEQEAAALGIRIPRLPQLATWLPPAPVPPFDGSAEPVKADATPQPSTGLPITGKRLLQ